MRSSGGTNVGLDWSVVVCTNSFIADFAPPSFHEGSGSSAAWTFADMTQSATNAAVQRRFNGLPLRGSSSPLRIASPGPASVPRHCGARCDIPCSRSIPGHAHQIDAGDLALGIESDQQAGCIAAREDQLDQVECLVGYCAA